MAKKEKADKAEQDQTVLPTFFRKASAEFIRAAAKKAGKPRAVWQREVQLAAAAKVLGKEPPKVAEFRTGAGPSPITIAAEKAGLTVRQFMKKVTLESLAK